MLINYITNQSTKIISGGWSGISFNVWKQLSGEFEVNYIGPINPKPSEIKKGVDKAVRVFGGKSNFSFYSNKRLKQISSLVSKELVPAGYNLFFGQTPWIECNFLTPYGVYMDADFKTYLEIYSTRQKFRKKDIERISRKEEKWLQNSRHIFAGSQWIWDKMCSYYDLDENKKTVVWTGGNVPIPEKDNYNGNLNLLFISLNFEKKGGPLCIEVFKQLKKEYSEAVLTIIGQKPPEEYLQIKGIEYAGLLRKDVPNEMLKFQNILSNAFVLIHPTVMDTMGAVIIEAGYYGCPAIAPASFGIPELIIHNETGIVVNVPFGVKNFYEALKSLIQNPLKYKAMRETTWQHCNQNLTWDAIGKRINKVIATTIK